MSKWKLSDVARRFKRPYQDIYLGVVAGVIPAERSGNGSRWLIDEKNLPRIAAQLEQERTRRRKDL